MAWCRQATSHYLSQRWPRSLSPYGVTRPQCVVITYYLTACPVPDYDDRWIVLGHIKLLILTTSFIWKSTIALHYRHSTLVVNAITLFFICNERIALRMQPPAHLWWNGNTFRVADLFSRVNHRSLVDSPHKGQWRGPLMYSLIYAWTNAWINNRDASDLRRHCAHHDVTEMSFAIFAQKPSYQIRTF